MFLRYVCILAAAGLMGLWPAWAKTQTLTLQDAVSRALTSHPALRAEGAAISAAERQAELDGLAPPPTVGGELENFAGTGAFSGVDSAETTLRLGRVFELGGKRAARQGLGAAHIARQRNVAAQRRLDVAAETTRRFIDVVARQERLDLTEQELALAGETRKGVAYRVQRGRSPEADLSLADLAVIRAELERDDAGHELGSARVALSVLWGEEAPDFERASGSVDRLPEVPGFEALAQRLPENPDQRTFALEAEQLDAQGRLATASGRPDVTSSLGVRRFEAFDDQALVLSFSLPLGLGDRSALALARNRAERESLEARRTAAGLDAYRTLFARYQELRHARHEVEALRDRMLPAAQKALELTQRGYEDARFSFLQVAQARDILLGLRNDRIAAAARYHSLLAEIERATAVSGELAP